MHGPAGGEAKLHYLPGSFEVVRPGAFVVCAVTGEKIAVDELRYWNADVQEAYVSAGVSFRRSEDLRAQKK